MLEAIEGLVKLVYYIGLFETSGHFDIYFILQVSIEEYSFNIYLFDLLIVSGGYSEQNLIGYRLDYYSEGFVKVDSVLLFESTDNLTSFIAGNLPSKATL